MTFEINNTIPFCISTPKTKLEKLYFQTKQTSEQGKVSEIKRDSTNDKWGIKEGIITLNVYAPNKRESNCVKQKLIELH